MVFWIPIGGRWFDMVMAIGKLRHCVSIERRLEARDEFGQPLEGPVDWENVVPPVWADVRPTAGRERMTGMQTAGEVSHTVAVHYQALLDVAPEVASAWRIRIGSRVLQVLHVRDLDWRHQWLVFECAEGGRRD